MSSTPISTVVIIDDSTLVRDRLGRLIHDMDGLAVVAYAANGRHGVDVVRRHAPDLVILDVQLPGANGIEVLKEIRRVDGVPRVIVFTNYPFAQYRAACLEAGAAHFFDKTTEFQQMVDVLRELGRPSGE